jgi:hypothetical protein
MNKDVKLVFECEDLTKEKFDVEYTFSELINNLNSISKNGRVNTVKNMHIVTMREGKDVYGSLKEHFENTCDGYCESMTDKEFEWMIDALVEKTKQFIYKKIDYRV